VVVLLLRIFNHRDTENTEVAQRRIETETLTEEPVVRWSDYAIFFANRITPNNSFLLGIDYLWWRTNYKGLQHGTDNRVNIFLQYNF